MLDGKNRIVIIIVTKTWGRIFKLGIEFMEKCLHYLGYNFVYDLQDFWSKIN